MNYEARIGLEVHIELKTLTKLFCNCKNEFGGVPNSRVCPVCTGQPGSLPQTNKNAVFLALRACSALGCTINQISKQCRKHYFYPDLPKGYQISQRETPLGINGEFDFLYDGKKQEVRIRQVHIEEDAGKLVHFEDGKTGVDYNRTGVPLIEIVTQPDLRGASEARAFLEALRRYIIKLGVSDCRMQEGALRCDVNVSLYRDGEKKLNPRVEMKNINTFSGVERAIEYEIARQVKVYDADGTVFRETRRWDDEKRKSFVMRSKEDERDYKFMPDPDIPEYIIDDAVIEKASADMPEKEVLFAERIKKLGVSDNDIEVIISDTELSAFFDGCTHNQKLAKEAAKLLVGDVSSVLLKNEISISESGLAPSDILYLAKLITDGRINRGSGKKVIETLVTTGGDVKKIASGFEIVSDEAELSEIVSSVIHESTSAVNDLKSGKSAAFGYLMGMCMRKTSGKADSAVVKKLLEKELSDIYNK